MLLKGYFLTAVDDHDLPSAETAENMLHQECPYPLKQKVDARRGTPKSSLVDRLISDRRT